MFEEFKISLLNRANEVLGGYTLGKGGITGNVVDVKLLFAIVLRSGSTSIITPHNHPSGNLKPSNADIIIHKQIKKVAETINISFLDNFIISKDGFFSFEDN